MTARGVTQVPGEEQRSDAVPARPAEALARRLELVWTGFRIVFGLFFLSMGLWAVSSAFGFVSPPQQPTKAAADFSDALTKTGFMDPLLGASFIFGGTALTLRRSAPLGIVMLAPSVAVILLFHLFLTGQYIWGSFVAAYFLALAWHHRGRLVPLWQAPARPGKS